MQYRQAAYELLHSSLQAASELHSSLQAASELQHSSLQSCSTAAVLQPSATSEPQHSSLQSYFTAAAQQLQSPPPRTESRAQARIAPKTAPERDRTLAVLQSHARAVLQALCSPYDCRPYGLQLSKLTDPQSTEFYPLS